MKTVQPDKVFLIDEESGLSRAWMKNESNMDIIKELYDNMPLWMMPYILKMKDDERLNPYVELRNEPFRANAKRDPRDKHDEDFARVLLARKLDAKYQERIAKEYGVMAMKFFKIADQLYNLKEKHYRKAFALDDSIDEMCKVYEYGAF